MRKSSYTVEQQKKLLEDMRLNYNASVISKKQIELFVKKTKMPYPHFIFKEDSRNVARGQYSIADVAPNPFKAGTTSHAMHDALRAPVAESAPAMLAQVVPIATKRAMNVTESFVPEKNQTYVPFGFFNDLKNIIKSNIFYPIYITGLSGNGKTFMVEQVCASLGRELIRVNITKRTDETDLIGSYELVDGNTIRREGPVVTAMRRGAVLLLDETDYGTEDLLCLQPILEGKPYFDKKTGEIIHPTVGFNVIATANTKGKGSDDGRFIGANLLNEAFLERFAITVEQEYPSAATERKILEKNFDQLGINDNVFVGHLINWAESIRKSFEDGVGDEVISTRRLVHIAKAYSIFKDRRKAVEMCLNRFDTDTKTSFLDFYSKLDAEVILDNPAAAPTEIPTEQPQF